MVLVVSVKGACFLLANLKIDIIFIIAIIVSDKAIHIISFIS